MERICTPEAPLVIVGTFSLTGTPLADHCAGAYASAALGGVPVLAVGPLPGAFAETDLRGLLAGGPVPGAAVIYVRPLLRSAAGGGPGAVLRQLRRARRLVRTVPDAVVIRAGGSVVDYLAGLFVAGNRARTCTLAVPPHIALSRLTGVDLRRSAPRDAARSCLARISAAGGPPLRLTPAHVRAAARRLPARDPLKVTLEDLLPLMEAIPPRLALEAVRAGGLRLPAPAAAHALTVAPGRPLPRIVEHLKLVGAKPHRWRRYLPPQDLPLDAADRRVGAVLRHLAGLARPADAAVLADLTRPLGPPSGPTRLDLVSVVALRPPVGDAGVLAVPWHADSLAPHLPNAVPPSGPPSLRVVGLAAPRTGLAQNFRMTCAALDRAEVPALPVRLGSRGGVPPSAPRTDAAEVRRSAVIWHLNADRIPTEMVERFGAADAYHIGFLLWELDRLPRAHRLALEMLDEIWVPSAFLQGTYARAFDGPVIDMGKGIALPEPSEAAPGWQPGPRFLCCFDFHSSVARKNPLAAVEGFRAAFPPGTAASLIVKTTPGSASHWGDPEGQLARIAEIAARDPRVRLVRDHLPFRDLLGWIRSADALVSSHRAEGFGYLPAHALSLGVPVIATAWSGTQDFCTADTAYPVRRSLVPVPDGHTILPTPGARWAEVDVDALAAAMRRVASHPQEARARALRGQRLMQTRYSLDALARRYAARLDVLGIAHPARARLAS